MTTEYLNYEATGFFAPLVTDYLSKKETLRPLYNIDPSIANFKQLIEQRQKYDLNRTLLMEVLREQYAGVDGVEEKVQKNIDLLQASNTFTITTGHQLCLFTGPLYFIYKIITTVKLSQELQKAYPTYNFVPVYWMASEDHDFEEINHFFLHGKKITWNKKAKGPVGRLGLEEMQELRKFFIDTLGSGPGAEQIIRLFDVAYLNKPNLAKATQILVNELFGKYGLVILDGDNRRLKKSFIPFMRHDILEHGNIQTVENTSKLLEREGYKLQLVPRQINFFYLQDGLRERIETDGKNFKVLNTSIVFTPEQLHAELENFPERFSPNVVTRPLYQEHILPNLAYVGGGGELAYWLQLKKMFELNNVFFPALVLRNSILLIDKQSADRIKKLKLYYEDIFLSYNELSKKFVLSHASAALDTSAEEKQIVSIYSQLAEKAFKIDPTLKPAVEARKQRQLNELATIRQKMVRAQKRKLEVQLEQIKTVQEKLFPGKELQERYDNFAVHSMPDGVGKFIEQLLDALEPLDFRFSILKD